MFDLAGKSLGKVELPGKGTVDGFSGDQDDKETFFVFTSYNRPTSVYRYDVLANKTELIRQPKVKFDPDKFAVEQVFYNSKDGTRVPMMLAYRKDLATGQAAANAALRLRRLQHLDDAGASSPSTSRWMELGGVLAVANLRGGGEYGEEWHLAGKTRQEAKRVRRLHRRGRVADRGGPHVAREARHHGRQQRRPAWSAPSRCSGPSCSARASRWSACSTCSASRSSPPASSGATNSATSRRKTSSKRCSPIRPITTSRKATKYPPTLIMTADTDDRVVPMHSFKFAAALQRAQAGDAPILLRIEERAGHGAGTPVKKLIEIAADRWAFLVKERWAMDDRK